MRRPDSVPAFSKALLSGALTGIAATITNLVYDVAFRGITKYYPAEEFSFFAIILASMIVLMILGMLFYLFIKYTNMVTFVIALLIIMAACICTTALVHADANEAAFYGNHGLIAGFILLSGILALTLMPYLYKHPKIYI